MILRHLAPLALFAGVCSAQFHFGGGGGGGNIFEQLFHNQAGGGGGQQHHGGGGGHTHAAIYRQHADAVQCPASYYLCPVTLECVKKPTACPCPDPEDIKCTVPATEGVGGTVFCTRGKAGCDAVGGALKFGKT